MKERASGDAHVSSRGSNSSGRKMKRPPSSHTTTPHHTPHTTPQRVKLTRSPWPRHCHPHRLQGWSQASARELGQNADVSSPPMGGGVSLSFQGLPEFTGTQPVQKEADQQSHTACLRGIGVWKGTAQGVCFGKSCCGLFTQDGVRAGDTSQRAPESSGKPQIHRILFHLVITHRSFFLLPPGMVTFHV